MSKIYDCFLFFNELDLLELRLNILDPYVDYFVISEASVTHSGLVKPYYYDENKERFSKFSHKIIHLKIDCIPNDFTNLPTIKDVDTPYGMCIEQIHNFIKNQTNKFNRVTEPHFGRDFFQKESIRCGLIDCDDEDIILSSDLDEIPNPDIVKNASQLLKNNKFYTFNQTTYYYYLNMLKEYNWKGSRMGFFKDLKNYSYNELRGQNNTDIPNGGWHFSFMGGPEKVKTKIQSYSHQELNKPHILNSVSSNIDNGNDPFFRGKLSKVSIDESYPQYLLENITSYSHMVKD